jgi:hypothetical protein
MSKARELAQKPNQPTGRKNLIINGAMNVAQRNSSSAVLAVSGESYDTVDRFKFAEGTSGAFTSEQSSDAPDGFSNSVELNVTTADTSLAAGEYAYVYQAIEAQDLQHLGYGTNSAKTLTLSFWVKSSKTGTYCITFNKFDITSYHFVKEYTIDTADTWEKKTITIEPDSNIKASGAAIGNDNGLGLRVFWGLAWGATYNGGTDNVWTTDTTDYATSNQANWMDSTSNNFYLTGVQLEVGSVATEFEHRSFGEELALCQRYYHQQERTANPIKGVYIGIGQVGQTTQALAIYTLPVSMRTTPTLAHGTVGAGATSNYTGTLSAFYADNLHFSFYFVSSGMVVGDVIRIYNSGPGEKVTFDAEL